MTSAKLQEAFEKGELQLFENTLRECPNKGQTLQLGPNPIICQAAAKGTLTFVGAILDVDPWCCTLVDPSDRSPLMLAALNGHIETVNIIIEKKPAHCANKTLFNQVDINRMNALHLAVLGGRENVVLRLLVLGEGVGCSGREKRGLLPLHLACSKGMAASVGALCERMSKEGECEVGVDGEGNGPLHLATKEGFEGVVAALLAWREPLNIDPDHRDKEGMTALEWAEVLGHDAVADMLRSVTKSTAAPSPAPPTASAQSAPSAASVAAGMARGK